MNEKVLNSLKKLWSENTPGSITWVTADYIKKNNTLDNVVVDSVLHSAEWEFWTQTEIRSQLSADLKVLTMQIAGAQEDDIKHITNKIKAIKDIQKVHNWDSVEAPKDIKKVYVYTVNDNDYSIQEAGKEASIEDRIKAMRALNHEEIK